MTCEFQLKETPRFYPKDERILSETLFLYWMLIRPSNHGLGRLQASMAVVRRAYMNRIISIKWHVQTACRIF